ncbi:MAG TPA: respiratory nitrate reductase subunit gamma, partial [Candidatus Acidoferrum sp.]|nr:respiratory nitrate reductase subunit gamma [Candidatus Acidoferrum sp.]
GPEQKPIDERIAELASFTEVELGRDLFHGRTRLTGGGMACAGCHAVREDGEAVGGSFGPDLTGAYADYRDRALTLFLRRPCFRRMPESSMAGFLMPHESFALKAYLRKVALSDRPPPAPAAGAAVKPVEWAPPSGSGTRLASLLRVGTDAESEFLFLFFPYAAVLLLFAGLGVRHALARRNVESLRTDAAAARRLFGGSAAWRVSLAVTAALHVLTLILPDTARTWNGTPLRLYLLEGTGFLFGLIVLTGWAQIMWRHVCRTAWSKVGRASEIADCVLLSLLFVAIASGLLTALFHRWGSAWAGGTLSPYLASLLLAEPVGALVAQMPFLVKLHVFSLFALVAVLPLTSAALIPVAAVERAVSLAARPASAGARLARTALVRISPARWIWPEEDLVDIGAEGAGAGLLADEVGSAADGVVAAGAVAVATQPEMSALVYGAAESENPKAST